jgi:hypothetical protein
MSGVGDLYRGRLDKRWWRTWRVNLGVRCIAEGFGDSGESGLVRGLQFLNPQFHVNPQTSTHMNPQFIVKSHVKPQFSIQLLNSSIPRHRQPNLNSRFVCLCLPAYTPAISIYRKRSVSQDSTPYPDDISAGDYPLPQPRSDGLR